MHDASGSSVRTDMSFTLFLSDPETYEAGDDTPLLLDKAIGNLLRMWGED